MSISISLFQSTLPMKGATFTLWGGGQSYKVSIHAPNEGSDDMSNMISVASGVSIHAPNEGSDLAQIRNGRQARFQSTLPMKGATRERWRASVSPLVSIHAPNEGSDF